MQSKALKKIIKNPTAMVCIALLLVIIFACTFCKVLAPYGFDDQELANRLQGPSAAHIFGTDEYGRDVFSRVLYGGQNSIVIGFAAVVLSIVIGGTLGMLAGYFKKAEAIIMRLIDIRNARHPVCNRDCCNAGRFADQRGIQRCDFLYSDHDPRGAFRGAFT